MITKAKFKELCGIGKQWVKNHPRATIAYGFALSLFISFMFMVCAPSLKLGAQIMKGEIKNTVTYDQLTGLVIITATVVMFVCVYIWSMFFVRLGERAEVEEDKKLKVTNYTQTGELKMENDKT